MAKKSPPEISPVMKTLATYIAQAGRKSLPKEVAERTKHHLLDTIAAMVSGSRLPPGRAAISYIKTLGTTPQPGWVSEGACESSVSSACASMPLANAALLAVVSRSVVITWASGVPPFGRT